MTAACPPPRQTGRADFPHPAFAWRCCAKHSQLEISPTCLAFTLGFSLQSRNFAGRLASLTVSSAAPCPVVVWLPIPISSVAFSVRLAHAKAPWLHGHYPASSLLWASPTPQPPERTLFLHCAPGLLLPWADGRGLPACPTELSLRAVPFHPGGLRRCSQTSLHAGSQASAHPEDWPPSVGVTRPIWVRLRYGSQVRSTELQRGDYSPRRPLHYMLDVQFA